MDDPDPVGGYGYQGNGRAVYECRRVELNGLASDPDRFIAWVESKLEDYDCNNKLVPPRKINLEKGKSVLGERVENTVRGDLSLLLQLEEMVKEVTKSVRRKISVKDIPAALADWAEELKPEAWGSALEQMVANRVADKAELVRGLARKRIAQSRDGASGAGK